MLSVILRTVKNHRSGLIVYTVINLILVWLFVGMFPSFSGQADELNKLIDLYPKEMMQAIGVDDISTMFSSIEGFLATEQYSLMWPILVIIFAIGLGSSAIAGEVERGTIELLLSEPVSRVKLFLSKYISGMIVLAVFAVFSIWIVVPMAYLYGIDYVFDAHLYMTVLGFLFSWAVFSITIMFSSFFSEKGKASMIPAGIMIFMYVAVLAARLQEDWEFLKHFSLFHYLDAETALFNLQISNEAILVFVGTAVVTGLIGLFWFNRRDIAV